MRIRICVSLTGAGLLAWILVAGAASAASEQQKKKLTAREMFYTAPAASAPQPQPTPPPKPPGLKPPSPTPPQPPEPSPKVVAVAYKPTAPLGVRYSILKKLDDQTVEVDPGGVFRAGDRIRVSVEVNDTAYLYIVNRGTSGAWKVLFPSAEIEGGNNRVERGRRYEVPAGYVFTFDEQPGTEQLFLVLSRQPEADLEKLIYSLSRRPAETPAAPPPEEKGPKLLLAQNLGPIDDSLVGRLRRSYARDLIIEKVNESTPGEKKETAVYVVNKATRADSRVVVDISLNHQ